MKEVLKQMVKALETEAEIYNDHDPEDGPPEYIVEALKVGRQAIANSEPQASPWKEYWMDIVKEINDLHERIAEAEKQEPFGFAALDEVTEHFNSVNCGTVYRLQAEGRSPLYTRPQPKREPLTDEQIKRLIVEFGKEFNDFDSLPEVCLLVSYDPEVGSIPERWEPKWHVFQAVRYVLHADHNLNKTS